MWYLITTSMFQSITVSLTNQRLHYLDNITRWRLKGDHLTNSQYTGQVAHKIEQLQLR